MLTPDQFWPNIASLDGLKLKTLAHGRYMSLYGLTWHVAVGISLVMGDYFSSQFGPRAPWFSGVLIGTLALLAFYRLHKRQPVSVSETPIS